MTSPPFVPLNTGDTADDDGQVIDDFFIETDMPAEPVVEPIPAPEPVPQKTPGKLLTGYLNMDPTWTPSLLLPPDLNRDWVRVSVPGSSGGSSSSYEAVDATEPAAGQFYEATTPAGSTYLYTQIRFTLNTSATVATRTTSIMVYITSAVTGLTFSMPFNTTLTASSSQVYQASANAASTLALLILPSNGLAVPAGATLRISPSNMDVGDTITNVAFTRQTISASGAASGGYVQVASDPGQLNGAARLYVGEDAVIEYTGPIYAQAVGSATPINWIAGTN